MEELSNLKQTLESAMRKLKAGFDDGPFGPDVQLTTAEACILYRAMTEQLGVKIPD